MKLAEKLAQHKGNSIAAVILALFVAAAVPWAMMGWDQWHQLSWQSQIVAHYDPHAYDESGTVTVVLRCKDVAAGVPARPGGQPGAVYAFQQFNLNWRTGKYMPMSKPWLAASGFRCP